MRMVLVLLVADGKMETQPAPGTDINVAHDGGAAGLGGVRIAL
jgi:hypothetical protein